jgi:hypothetical protein
MEEHLSNIQKIAKDITKVFNKYPNAEFGVWINRQNLLDTMAELLSNPMQVESFFNIMIRIKNESELSNKTT